MKEFTMKDVMRGMDESINYDALSKLGRTITESTDNLNEFIQKLKSCDDSERCIIKYEVSNSQLNVEGQFEYSEHSLDGYKKGTGEIEILSSTDESIEVNVKQLTFNSPSENVFKFISSKGSLSITIEILINP